jgi:hypothetical protein
VKLEISGARLCLSSIWERNLHRSCKQGLIPDPKRYIENQSEIICRQLRDKRQRYSPEQEWKLSVKLNRESPCDRDYNEYTRVGIMEVERRVHSEAMIKS